MLYCSTEEWQKQKDRNTKRHRSRPEGALRQTSLAAVGKWLREPRCPGRSSPRTHYLVERGIPAARPAELIVPLRSARLSVGGEKRLRAPRQVGGGGWPAGTPLEKPRDRDPGRGIPPPPPPHSPNSQITATPAPPRLKRRDAPPPPPPPITSRLSYSTDHLHQSALAARAAAAPRRGLWEL